MTPEPINSKGVFPLVKYLKMASTAAKALLTLVPCEAWQLMGENQL